MNGNGKWLLWSAGCILTIIITVMSFMANAIYANEVRSVEDRRAIRREFSECLEGLRREMKADLREAKMEILTAIKDK